MTSSTKSFRQQSPLGYYQTLNLQPFFGKISKVFFSELGENWLFKSNGITNIIGTKTLQKMVSIYNCICIFITSLTSYDLAQGTVNTASRKIIFHISVFALKPFSDMFYMHLYVFNVILSKKSQFEVKFLISKNRISHENYNFY